MNTLKKKWKIYLIHHTHTDVGYTERQEKIERYHVDYMKQAVRLCQKYSDFRWTCESFWGVEKFLEKAAPAYKDAFAECIRKGQIELTAGYLNLGELAGGRLYDRFVQRAYDYASSLQVSLDSAMTSDVNGLSLDYARSLERRGVKNFFMGLHTHHGMFPLHEKMRPFLWNTEPGRQILVWNGEIYVAGNEMGLMPEAINTYSFKDEFDAYGDIDNLNDVRKTRIYRYLSELEREGYPADFMPMAVHGTTWDNAPPNAAMLSVIDTWNKEHGSEVEIVLSTLGEFFDRIRKDWGYIPTYSGEWPDWWTDGVGSTPRHTAMFRDAQRTWELTEDLGAATGMSSKGRNKKLEDSLMLFSEHTWGHFASIEEPFDKKVQLMEARKEAYATLAHIEAYDALDAVKAGLGEVVLEPGLPFDFKVINPYDRNLNDYINLTIETWESYRLEEGFSIHDEKGKAIPFQKVKGNRGFIICLHLILAPREICSFTISPRREAKGEIYQSRLLQGVDGVSDIVQTESDTFSFTDHGIETQLLSLSWKSGTGIDAWKDKRTGRSLIASENQAAPFSPVYEISEAPSRDAMWMTRQSMGRNRKSWNVRRNAGLLKGIKNKDHGPLFSSVELLYECPGTDYYSVILRVYKESPRVDVKVHIQKDCVWDPENLYISLPFYSDNGSMEIRILKSESSFVPGVDQLPGTLQDYYACEDGVCIRHPEGSLLITMPDTPLVQLGALEHQPRELKCDKPPEDRKLYSWCMNNFWETNFKASCEGFYEFEYSLHWGSSKDDSNALLNRASSLNKGPVWFRMKR